MTPSSGSARRLAAWLNSVAPAGTAAAVGPIAPVSAYGPAEAAAVAGAVPRRGEEFLTGRALARRALAALGCEPAEIPVGNRRLPVWPDGYLGSISHAGGLCAAQVARRTDLLGVGVDIELANAFSPEMRGRVCSLAEWERLSRGQAPRIDLGALCFSAKEAVYKAYFPAARAFLEFSDVQLQVDWGAGAFAALLCAAEKPAVAGRRIFTGRFARIDDYIATAVWIAASPTGTAGTHRMASPAGYVGLGMRGP